MMGFTHYLSVSLSLWIGQTYEQNVQPVFKRICKSQNCQCAAQSGQSWPSLKVTKASPSPQKNPTQTTHQTVLKFVNGEIILWGWGLKSRSCDKYNTKFGGTAAIVQIKERERAAGVELSNLLERYWRVTRRDIISLLGPVNWHALNYCLILL